MIIYIILYAIINLTFNIHKFIVIVIWDEILRERLNKLKLSYKISYAVALALRYIPDIQATYWDISAAQQARGYELSSKAKLSTRLKGAINIIIPLIFSSLERINTISTAMQLRRFGSKKKRTWYTQRPFNASDWFVVILAIVLFGITLYLFKLNHGRFYDPFN